MITRLLRHPTFALLVMAMLVSPVASAQVDVEIIGDTAHATILLVDGQGSTYDAEVTIAFHEPVNLTADSLNLTAELFDPADPAMTGRLPPGISFSNAFPMIVTVEPFRKLSKVVQRAILREANYLAAVTDRTAEVRYAE